MTYPSAPQPDHTSTPIANYLARYRGPGLSPDGGYVVLPRALLEQLPPPLQHQLAQALQQTHQFMSAADWPVYRIVPSRWAPISKLDDEQLREAGLTAELDGIGELVYRELATGRQLSPEEASNSVLVRTPDRSPRPHQSPPQ